MTDPVRTCVGCRSRILASAMQRVTKATGSADLVFGGPSSGRGAWVCSEVCKEKALTSGAFDRSFSRRSRKSAEA